MTDALPQTVSKSQPRPPAKNKGWQTGQGRWWKRSLLLLCVVAVLVPAGWLIPSVITSSDESGPRLTYTVTRGDLIVSVTEQGTLESSENTEIICQVRGQNTVIQVVESGTYVEPGQLLVKLDTLFIEEAINERTKYAHWSRSGSERSKADETVAKLAIDEYKEGRFPAELMTLKKDLAIAQSNLRSAQNMLAHAKMKAKRGYVSSLQVEERDFEVIQAQLNVDVKITEIDILERFKQKEELETLEGNLRATIARHKANVERAFADKHRLDRSLVELKQCEIRADRSGLVIYPSAAAWKDAPDIAEGATVHKDQVLLLMPDLTQMQVKVGIHESLIERVATGLIAKVRLPDRALQARVSSVAEVTSPGGWWTGGVVKYDTIIRLPSVDGLKPGMSAEVEIILAEHENVLTVPVAAVVETEDGEYCWVKTADGPERRSLQLGDSNDTFIIVEDGLQEGDEVILNALAFVKEAQTEVLKPSQDAKSQELNSKSSDSDAL